MDAVHADIHKGCIGKGGVKGIFNDSVFKRIVSGGILAVLEHGAPDLSQLPKQFLYLCESWVEYRTHGLQKDFPIPIRSLHHALQFLCAGCNGLFTQHMFAVFQHEYGLGAVAAVGACYVYRVHLRVIPQGLKCGIYLVRAVNRPKGASAVL